MSSEQDNFQMSNQKPYMLRAVFEWLVDNGCTPHLIVAYPGKGWVSGVPSHLTQDETLVLNISPNASPDCVIENDAIYFTTRFSGQSCSVSVDMRAVVGLVARENMQWGIGWELSEEIAHGLDLVDLKSDSKSSFKSSGPEQKSGQKQKKKPNHLKILK